MAKREPGPGERALAARQRRLWTIIGAMAAAGVVIGLGVGFESHRIGTGGEISPGLAIAGVAVLAGGILGAAWFYFRETDELDVRDNLIAGNAAMYFYAIAYPCWVLLSRAGLVPRTDSEILYVATLAVLSIVYFWKRWRP